MEQAINQEDMQMNVFENQSKLGRELFEINTQAVRRMAELAGEDMQKFFETNQNFASRLPEVKDINGFFELQREYGEALYSEVSERLQTRGEVIREAVERGGEVLRGAFNPEATAEAPAAKPAEAAAA